ncbi:MAG: hypothetical protein ACI4Q3_09800 [Kiritimatiellia bacterium]
MAAAEGILRWRRALLAALAACTLTGAASTAESDPVCITAGMDTWTWNTVFAGDGRVPRWAWPEGARSASVQIRRADGATAVRQVNRNGQERDGSCPFDVPEPAQESDETLLELSIRFHSEEEGSGEAVGEDCVARGIGLVCGTRGAAAVVLPAGSAHPGWTLVRNRFPVLPVPAGTTSLVAGGEELALAHVPGWVSLPALRCGQSASLELAGELLSGDATVTRVGSGIVLVFR